MNDLFEIELWLMEGVSITIPSLSLTIVWIRPRTIVAVHGLSRSFTVVPDRSLSFLIVHYRSSHVSSSFLIVQSSSIEIHLGGARR